MTVRGRLVLAFFYILLVVIIALEVPLVITMRKRAEAELGTRVMAEAQLVAGRIGAERIGDPVSVRQIIDQAAAQTGGRLVVVDAEGNLVADSDGSARVGSDFATANRPEITQALEGQSTMLIRHSEDLGTDLFAIATPIVDEQQVGALRITLPMADVEANLRRSTAGLIALGVTCLIAGLVIALGLSAWIARPLSKLAASARRLGQGDLSTRASQIRGPSEIRDVAHAFDDMAEQVQANVEAEREFSHNASHQLRTPLTGMRLRLENAMASTDDPDLMRQLKAADTEADRLATIVTRLLPSSVDTDRRDSCDVVDVVRRSVERARERGPDPAVVISVQAPPSLPIAAAEDDVAQILDNLLDNATRYAPGPVTVEIERDGAQAHVVVRDQGPGLSHQDRLRVWERFARGSEGSAEGSGLGLPIVRELAERWGGSAGFSEEPVAAATPARGLSVSVRLPLTDP